MTRAHRFAALSSVLTLIYILAFFSFIPVPLVSEDIADQLIPVVRANLGKLAFTDVFAIF